MSFEIARGKLEIFFLNSGGISGGKRYSCTQEGSGAFGARVLSFVRFAPNDGFCPQSGLVQRGVLHAAVGGIAAYGSENQTTAPVGVGNAPLFPCGDFPRRGKFTLRSTFTLISSSKFSVVKISPSGVANERDL